MATPLLRPAPGLGRTVPISVDSRPETGKPETGKSVAIMTKFQVKQAPVRTNQPTLHTLQLFQKFIRSICIPTDED
jgi:hypothetical protein